MVIDKKIRIFAFMQMLLISMMAVSIPALITTFQKVYNLSIAQSSIIPILGTVGGFITNLVVASYSANVGLKRLNQYFLIVGFSAAIILAFTNNIYLFLLGMILIGVNTAFGLTTTSTIFAHIKLKYQNYGLFHSFFGIGGIICPIIIGWILAKGLGYRYIYMFLMLIYLIILIFVTFSKLIENRKYPSIKLKEAFAIIRKKFILPVLFLIILQSGSEQGMVTWSGNLFQNGFGFTLERATLILSIYWVMFTLSRLLIQFIENRIGKLKTVAFGSLLVIAGLILIILTGNPLFFFVIAFGTAPIFPLMQKYSAQKLPEREVGLFNGLVFASASIGNVLIAGSMGITAEYSLKLAYLVPILAAGATFMIVLYLIKLKKSGEIVVSSK